MTAEIPQNRSREGQAMVNKDEDRSPEIIPFDPDEGWWAAVLADEPFDVDHVDPEINKESLNPCLLPPEQSCDSVNWQKIFGIFQKDEIVTLVVVGFNRGGILVSGKGVHGFVPASHLIDLPVGINGEERDHYFTSYLDRKISLKVIECEPDKDRVVFSERAALAKEGQRKHLLTSLSEGDVIRGTVTNVTPFGVFVDLGGLEGLIHISELSWGRIQHPSEVLKVDDKVTAFVLQVAEDKGRIALSLKQLEENPWAFITEKLNPGDVVKAEITCIVKFGAFAKIDEGIEGLIHISSMDFPKNCTHIDDFLFEGQSVKVCILSIEPEKRRLGLKLESCIGD